MSPRLLPLLVALALLGAACGVSRNEAAGSDATQEVEAGSGTTDETGDDDTDPDESADASDDGAEVDPSPTTEVTEPPTTAAPTTAPAADVAATIAFDNGTEAEILHGPINDVTGPTRDNEEFVTAVYRGAVPAGFEAEVLRQAILSEVLANELTDLGAGDATADDLDEARTALLGQLEPVFVSAPDPAAEAARLFDEVPYLPFLAELISRQIALSSALAETSDLDGDPCVRHILLEQEDQAEEVLAELEGGADFATLAAERSIGPTGPNGGDLGCAPAASYVPAFADAVTGAEEGVYVGPVETEFGFHVLVVDRYEVNGDQLAQEALTTSLQASTVSIDDRVGTWNEATLTIDPPG